MPMLAAIAGTMPLGNGTPTRYAIQKAVAHLKATPTNTPRYIVLATDGEPNCADGLTNALVDPDGAVEAIRMAATEGFKTYVIGIATQFGDANMTLNRMADAGGEPRVGDPRYYPVASRQDLVNALSLITGKVADCVFPLSKLPPSPNDVAVDVNGMRVTRDPTKMNGWDYTANNMAIQIHGPACEADQERQRPGEDHLRLPGRRDPLAGPPTSNGGSLARPSTPQTFHPGSHPPSSADRRRREARALGPKYDKAPAALPAEAPSKLSNGRLGKRARLF